MEINLLSLSSVWNVKDPVINVLIIRLYHASNLKRNFKPLSKYTENLQQNEIKENNLIAQKFMVQKQIFIKSKKETFSQVSYKFKIRVKNIYVRVVIHLSVA